MTRIIQEYPGYYWQYDEEAAQWRMYWEPVRGWYSPPKLHPEVIQHTIHVPLWFQENVGLLIGRQGRHFIRITKETGCFYIFYLSVQNKIEIWGGRDNIVHAIHRIRKLMSNIQKNLQQP